MFFFDQKTCNNCAGRGTLSSSCTVVHMLSFYMCNWFPAIICSMVGSVSHPRFMVWCVAVCGLSPFCLATSLKRVGVVLPSEHWRTHLRRETDICATSNFSTLISFTEPAFSGLLPLRVYESTQCVSVHPSTAELDSFFSSSQRWHRQEQKLFLTSLL